MLEQEDRILNKLDALQDDVSLIKESLARHEERSVQQHARIAALEHGTRKAMWMIFAGIGPAFAFVLSMLIGC
jgi:hypothetical protein